MGEMTDSVAEDQTPHCVAVGERASKVTAYATVEKTRMNDTRGGSASAAILIAHITTTGFAGVTAGASVDSAFVTMTGAMRTAAAQSIQFLAWHRTSKCVTVKGCVSAEAAVVTHRMWAPLVRIALLVWALVRLMRNVWTAGHSEQDPKKTGARPSATTSF